MSYKKSILAIDPGPQVCGWVVMQRDGSIDAGVCDTTQLLFSMIDADVMAIERFEARGMPLGDESLQTLIVTGRLMQRWIDDGGGRVIEVRRSEVKRALCGSAKATDANIRAALIDRYGGTVAAIGRKHSPGPLYGVKSHAWAALAVAVVTQGSLL